MTLTAGFNLVGSQFVKVGGETQDIQEFTASGNTMPGLDADSMFQTELLVWNGAGYDMYGWLDSDDGTANEVPEWNNSWLLYDMSDQAQVSMVVGDGYWIRSSAGGTVTFSGEVSSETSITKNLAAGFNLLANPFPEALSIQNIRSNDLPGLDADSMFQTELLVWNGAGYDMYGWLDSDDGTANEVPEWNNSWLLYAMSDLATAVIGIGEGFWIKPTAAGSVTFTK